MISAIATVIDLVKMNARQLAARFAETAARFRKEYAEDARPRALILLGGKYIRDAVVDTRDYQDLLAQRGAVLIGTYSFHSLEVTYWAELEEQIAKDCAAAVREYHEGRYTTPPNPPGEVEEPPACIRRRRPLPDA